MAISMMTSYLCLTSSVILTIITSTSGSSSELPPKGQSGHFAVPGSCPRSSRLLNTWRRIQADLSATERVALALEVAERLERVTPMGMAVVKRLSDLQPTADKRYVLIASTHVLGDLLGVMHDDNEVLRSYVSHLVDRRHLLPGTVADAMEAALHALFSVLAEVSNEISLNVWQPCLRRLLRHFRSLADDVTHVCARCDVGEGAESTGRQLSGHVIFKQKLSESRTHVKTHLRGFDVTDDRTHHALHVHETGSVVGGCQGAGSPYVPLHRQRSSRATKRPGGYLGNVEADDEGEVNVSFPDQQVSLVGPHSVIERSVVIHETYDQTEDPTVEEEDIIVRDETLIGCCVIHQVACDSI